MPTRLDCASNNNKNIDQQTATCISQLLQMRERIGIDCTPDMQEYLKALLHEAADLLYMRTC